MEVAQAEATKANLLDKAVRIRSIKRMYKSDTVSAPPMTEIIIFAAFYGQNISWLEVTDKLRRAVNGKSEWSGTVVTKDWGEPAPGFGDPRTLMIRYSVSVRESQVSGSLSGKGNLNSLNDSRQILPRLAIHDLTFPITWVFSRTCA